MSGDNQDSARAKVARPVRGEILMPISESEYINPSPERQAQLSDEIDRYYNTPLDMFPFAEQSSKPDRFYDFYEQSIAERFPDDADLRGFISEYSRSFFGSLVAYMLTKRVLLLTGLVGLWFLILEGPIMAAGMGMSPTLQPVMVIVAMLLIFPVLAGINALVFLQYRIGLENRSYELSRQIIQRTRELQNLYTTLRAMPDQEETRFQNEGEAWGKRSAYLIRLMMWVAQRMEYLEKFIQVEMWRVRRERYWINWLGGILIVLIILIWGASLALQPGGGLTHVYQGVAGVLGLGYAWLSYNLWKTPLNLAKDKLGAEGWIRYATLDLDNTIGDQLSRDKNRLVEYRTLNKGH